MLSKLMILDMLIPQNNFKDLQAIPAPLGRKNGKAL